MTKNKSKKSARKSDYRRTSIGSSTTPEMTKGTASFIERPAEKDLKRKKKKEAKKTDDGVVRRLAKNGLIDKGKVTAARKSSSKKKKRKGPSSSVSSYSDVDSSSSSTDSWSQRLRQPLRRWQEEEIEKKEVSQRRQ